MTNDTLQGDEDKELYQNYLDKFTIEDAFTLVDDPELVTMLTLSIIELSEIHTAKKTTLSKVPEERREWEYLYKDLAFIGDRIHKLKKITLLIDGLKRLNG